MNETNEPKTDQENKKSCGCEKHPMFCLHKVMHENPAQGIWWCLGIGFLVGWKIRSCLASAGQKS
jgi:hypothetical protein